MKTSDRIELVRTQVFTDFGPNVKLAKFLSLVWRDDVVDDYLRQSGINLDQEFWVHELICFGIWHFLTTVIELDDSEVVEFAPDTPAFLRIHLNEVHNDDEWRYSKLEEMVELYLSSNDAPYKNLFLLDMEPDESMEDLLKWLSLDTRRPGYIQEAEFKYRTMIEGGLFVELLQIAQVIEIDEMGQEFVKALDEMAESLSQ